MGVTAIAENRFRC